MDKNLIILFYYVAEERSNITSVFSAKRLLGGGFVNVEKENNKNKIKKLMFFVKNLLTKEKWNVIVHLTTNVKNLFFIVRFLARVITI
ncbi:MAG: hypothetical protein IJ327_04195 [Lachnospiraceae bacterium]|nr:hypothetical protein [Lachnospiraceae bacterium]